MKTRIPFSALIEEDWAILATYRVAVEDLEREETRRHG